MSFSLNRRFRLGACAKLAFLATLASCDTSSAELGPGERAAADLAGRLSPEHVNGVTVALVIAPAVVEPGDSVLLVATARNAMRQRLQIGVQCGPAMDVLIVTPTREVRSALSDVTNGGYFTCELSPYHFVEPDSSRVVQLRWVAPAVRGEYTVTAGLRRADGLGNPSQVMRLTVR